MDIDKLLEKVTSDEEIRGIPLIVIFKVIYSVLEAIGSGECFYSEVCKWDM